MDMEFTNIDNHATIDIDTTKDLPEYTYQWFMENDRETLYVLKEEGILIGVITIGDVFRFYEGKTSQVINSRYTALKYGEVEKAYTFFNKHWSIHELPVVDSQGKLMGIYRISDNNQDRNRFRERLKSAYYGKDKWLKAQIRKWFANCKATVFGFQLPTEDKTMGILSSEEQRKLMMRSGDGALEIIKKHTEQEARLYWGDRYEPDVGMRFVNEYANINIKCENGIIKFADFQGEFFTFQDGHRATPGNRNVVNDKKIYLVGPCTILGAYVCDEQTIEYYLQQLFENKEYEVINWGLCGPGNDLSYLLSEKIRPDDIIIISFSDGGNAWEEFFKEQRNYWGNWSEIYCEIRDPLNCILDNFRHVNYKVNQIIAKKIFERLSQEKIENRSKEYKDNPQAIQDYYIGWDTVSAIKKLAKKYKVKNVKMAGAVVMNCNPFTKGHHYLVETAMRQVDILYVFVVEEDKSIFSFKNRFEMVKQGIADLEGEVCVIPSGKYILSKDTFSQYFEKDKEIEEIANMDFDIRIFGEIVCKEFEISKRFAGEEPFDAVTRAYNKTMSRILPEYGVEFIEIPRKKMKNGEIISATQARDLINHKEWNKLRDDMLPESTLKILQEVELDV